MENEENKSKQDEDLMRLLAKTLASEESYDDEAEIEIDWIGLLLKLRKRWRFVALMTIFSAIIGVVVALMQPKTYTSEVTLAPESQSRSSSLSGLASMFGLGSVSTSEGDALNVGLFPEISTSLPFLTSLFDVQVTPYVSKKELKEGAKPATPIALSDYLNREKKNWLSSVLPLSKKQEADDEDDADSVLNLSNLTPRQNATAMMLGKSILAETDTKTGLITVSVTMDDPQIATELVDTVCQRLQDYIIAYRTKKVKEDLDYYTQQSAEAKEKMMKAQAIYAQSVDFDRSVILQSINSEKEQLQAEAQLAQQVYQQMETQKLSAQAKYQELKPVFTVIEPATFPQHPSSSSRKVVALAFMLVGFVLSCAWVLFGSDLLQNFCSKLKEKQNEAVAQV